MVSCMEENRVSIQQYMNINTVIIAINVAIFMSLSMMGDTKNGMFLMKYGAMYTHFLSEGEWWRLFSAMWLHFGAEHLISNMFMLWFVGNMLLKAFSWWQYGLTYLLSGLGGSMLSYLWMSRSDRLVISAGASGAIYGIVGALFCVVLKHGGQFEHIRTKQILLAVICYLSYGFTTQGVDAWAHLGGMVVGFLCTLVIYYPKKQD